MVREITASQLSGYVIRQPQQEAGPTRQALAALAAMHPTDGAVVVVVVAVGSLAVLVVAGVRAVLSLFFSKGSPPC